MQTILGTVCKDIQGSFNDTTKWVYSRGDGKCETIHQSDLDRHDVRLANQIVFVFQVIENKIIILKIKKKIFRRFKIKSIFCAINRNLI